MNLSCRRLSCRCCPPVVLVLALLAALPLAGCRIDIDVGSQRGSDASADSNASAEADAADTNADVSAARDQPTLLWRYDWPGSSEFKGISGVVTLPGRRFAFAGTDLRDPLVFRV